MFLVMMPNLRVLDVGSYPLWAQHYLKIIAIMFERAIHFLNNRIQGTQLPQGLSLLELEELHATDTTVSKIEYMLLHPGLTTLRLSWTTWSEEDIAVMSTSPLSLKHADCFDCDFDTAGIENILTRCPSLHTLRITIGEFGLAPIDYSVVGTYFRRFGLRLRLLEFKGNPNKVRVPGFTGRIGSLKELDRLAFLSINYDNFVMGHEDGDLGYTMSLPPLALPDVLPASLERLELTFDHEYQEFALSRVVSELVTSSMASKLRWIRLKRPKNHTGFQFPVYVSMFGWEAVGDTLIRSG